jgi:molecular chaperone DnaK
VNVSAKDLGTGKSQAMTITGGSALNKDEIDRMMRDAEQHAAEDKKRREEAELRNQAETLVYQTEKFVKENDEKVPSDVKDAVNAALGEAQSALKGTDTEAIKRAMEKLATESQKLGAALYQQQGQAGGDQDLLAVLGDEVDHQQAGQGADTARQQHEADERDEPARLQGDRAEWEGAHRHVD